MNYEYLEHFLMVAEMKNFTKAASALFLSQSALSRQIASLEEEFNVTLFTRGWAAKTS